MKHHAFMILVVFSIAFFNQPYLGQIRDLSEHPDEIAMHVNVVNNGNDDAFRAVTVFENNGQYA